jgi:hypothetical protein
MFCGCAGHLDEFCFRRKRIERRRVEYARDPYHDEFIDFPLCSYSHVPPRFYSCASPQTFSCALPQFAHGPNHRSYGFGPQENCFEPRRFGYGPRLHLADRFPRRTSFPAGGSFTSHSAVEVQRTVKTSSSRMVKCWIPKIYLTNPSTKPSTFSHPM